VADIETKESKNTYASVFGLSEETLKIADRATRKNWEFYLDPLSLDERDQMARAQGAENAEELAEEAFVRFLNARAVDRSREVTREWVRKNIPAAYGRRLMEVLYAGKLDPNA
jgi:butyrate kinase